MNSGIYIILNIISLKTYIGSAVNLRRRETQHWWDLKNNRHSNQYLQRAYNKYGQDSFRFSILEYCRPEECVNIEQQYLDFYQTYRRINGYNICKKADSVLGRIMTEETKIKISKSNKGRKLSPDQVEVLRIVNTGKKLSEEHKMKIKLGNTGKKMSQEAILKLSNHRKGKPLSEANKQSIRLSKLKNPRRGYKLSEEHKRKIALAHTGKKASEETRIKLSQAHKKRNTNAK